MRLLLLILLMTAGFGVRAEEWGLTFGLHDATVESGNSEIGVHGGILTSLFFSKTLKLRSGLIYTQRHFDLEDGGHSYFYHYDDVDLPALLQYNVRPGFGVFAGPVFGFNVLHDVSGSPALNGSGVGAEILPLLQMGTNFIFDNMYGFDVFFEEALQPIDANARQFKSVGLSFVYYVL